MNNAENTIAILNYESYDRMPLVHFGFWEETLEKWHMEGHITADEAAHGAIDHSPEQRSLAAKLGFDFCWGNSRAFPGLLYPPFVEETVEILSDGSRKIRNSNGVIILQFPGIRSIPQEFDHMLKDRTTWERHFLPRLQDIDRIVPSEMSKWKSEKEKFDEPICIHLGSQMGIIRDWLGLENFSYLQVDDEALFREIAVTIGNLTLSVVEKTMALAKANDFKFDYAHYWEDICFRGGPLINPVIFNEICGPFYRRMTSLLKDCGLSIVSVDCDGKIDSLLPVWLENGVNTMFPIEVGTWGASIAPWREKYGKALRGVGGMDKNLFASGRCAIAKEVERLKRLVEIGGYIPCPDHRIPPNAKFELVRYYCEFFRKHINQ